MYAVRLFHETRHFNLIYKHFRHDSPLQPLGNSLFPPPLFLFNCMPQSSGQNMANTSNSIFQMSTNK